MQQITFTKDFRSYKKGQTGGFRKNIAQVMISLGVAEMDTSQIYETRVLTARKPKTEYKKKAKPKTKKKKKLEILDNPE